MTGDFVKAMLNCGKPIIAAVDGVAVGSREIRFAGLGTEKVEDALKQGFPQANVSRMDSDTLKRKEDYRRILTEFRVGKIDILIGTQMIAKGLHFPNVTLVGIIYADLSLHLPDFRAGERTFQLLTQVAGRSGRGDIEGEVFVQSFTPFHPAIQYARRHDFVGFYEQELEFRQQLKYPPVSRIAMITLKGRNEEKVAFLAEHLRKEMEPMLKVAAEFPDVRFEHATGYKTAENMRIYDAKFYEDAYMAGIIAGTMTKTNTLGFVASFPIPEVLRNINAFTLGAQSVNPKVKTKVVWVNTWFDPPKEGDAAQSLINGGADVLLQNTDSSAVLQTAEKNGKYAFGWDSDMSAVAPKAHLASCIVDWGPYYKKAVKDVMDGTWKTERTVWGVKEGQNMLVKIADVVPADAKAKVEAFKEGLKAGTVETFTGPIVDNTGKERLAKGVMADQDWKDKVDFYVKGVEGKIPGGK
jgi:simple sugar transport system substrate-binding protein